MGFIEQFNKRLINVKNRKVISNYSTLLDVYINYYRSFTGNTLDYSVLLNYIDGIDNTWTTMIEQFVPATTILLSGEKISNISLHQQKHIYKHGIDDGSLFSLSGVSTNLIRNGVFNDNSEWTITPENKLFINHFSGINGTFVYRVDSLEKFPPTITGVTETSEAFFLGGAGISFDFFLTVNDSSGSSPKSNIFNYGNINGNTTGLTVNWISLPYFKSGCTINVYAKRFYQTETDLDILYVKTGLTLTSTSHLFEVDNFRLIISGFDFSVQLPTKGFNLDNSFTANTISNLSSKNTLNQINVTGFTSGNNQLFSYKIIDSSPSFGVFPIVGNFTGQTRNEVGTYMDILMLTGSSVNVNFCFTGTTGSRVVIDDVSLFNIV